MTNFKFQVLLYYKYVDIENPEQVMNWQRELCKTLSLKGRILIAKEGINGTVEGTVENTEKYIEETKISKYFSDMRFKKSESPGNSFLKLKVKVRPEVVTTKVPNLNPNIVSGKYITADELHKWFEEKREFYIVDMRNDFEYDSGFFENSLRSGMNHFTDLPKILPSIDHLRDATIVTVCTGGIRCEKASGFLLQNGFNDVYQLKDGIHTYMEKYPNKHFKGKLYVFDGRVTIGFNTDSPEHKVVGKCKFCEVKTDTYVNCEYFECHKHFIACKNCKDLETEFYFCNKKCKENYKKYFTKQNRKRLQQLTTLPI